MGLSDDVCRLCLGKDKLVWVFDKRFESGNNMKDVVFITTGVEIKSTDMISQKICEKCCQVTIKMFEFRRTSQKNDNYLKEECKKYLKTNTAKSLNTEVTIQTETKDEKRKTPEVKKEPILEPKQEIDEKKIPLQCKLHPTVQTLFTKYPSLKLPNICLKSNLDPVVSLQMDGVEDYFKTRNLDFNYYTRLALKPCKRIATKKTTSVKYKSTNGASHNREVNVKEDVNLINVQINRDKATNKISIKFTNKNDIPSVGVSKSSTANESSPSSKDKDLVQSKRSSEKKSENVEIRNEPVKRKFSEVEKTPVKETNKKPMFIESLGLTPKSSTESPAYVANVSVPLHICDICNSVQYCAKDLKKHQNKHLRCQFCKAKFRTLESKNEHINSSCVVKNSMNSLPNVVLKKVEFNKKVRTRYPNAFDGFPPLEDKTTVSDQHNTSVEESKIIDTDIKNSEQPKIDDRAQNGVEVIEIISDDDDENTTSNKKETDLLKNILLKTEPSSRNASESFAKNSTVPNPIVPNATTQASTSVPPILQSVEENIVYNTVSIVKPDIRLRGSSILDNIDPKISDVKLLKELLITYMPLQTNRNVSIQTDLPTNSSITVLNKTDATTEMRDLKHHLYSYRIPVTIKNGSFKVSYSYGGLEKKAPNKFALWNDLTPTDIKINTNVPTPGNSNQQLIKNSEKQGSDNGNLSAPQKHRPVNSSCTVSAPATTMSTITAPVSSVSKSNAHSVLSSASGTVDIPAKIKSTIRATVSGVSNSNTHSLSSSASGSVDIPAITTSTIRIPVSSVSKSNTYSVLSSASGTVDIPAKIKSTIRATVSGVSNSNTHSLSSSASGSVDIPAMTTSTIRTPVSSVSKSNTYSVLSSASGTVDIPANIPLTAITRVPVSSVSKSNTHSVLSSASGTVDIPAKIKSTIRATVSGVSNSNTHSLSSSASGSVDIPAMTTSTIRAPVSSVSKSNIHSVSSGTVGTPATTASKICIPIGSIIHSNASSVSPSTATYNIPHIVDTRMPANTELPQIAVNTSSNNPSNVCPSLPVNVFDVNNSITDLLQDEMPLPAATPLVSVSTGTAPVSSSPITVGSIRIKNVWELT